MIYRILWVVFFLLNTSFTVSNKNDEGTDMMVWSSARKLTWDDFQGTPKSFRGNTVAETHGRIMLESTSVANGVPTLIVKCFFLKNKSWTVVDDKETLEHEQLHFDLYEFYTRNIRRAFQQLNQQGVTDFGEYKKVFNYYTKQNDQMNQKYDREVYGNLEKQREWSQRIASALNKTQHFELK